MAEGENLDRRASFDAEAGPRAERTKQFDRNNTLNDLRNRLNQLDNKMKTIAVRDETMRRGSVGINDRALFIRQKSGLDDDGKAIRGVRFRREETEILDEHLSPRVETLSPRWDSSSDVYLSPRLEPVAESDAPQTQQDQSEDQLNDFLVSLMGEPPKEVPLTSEPSENERDRVSKDIARMEAEKALLLKELRVALESEISLEKEERAKLEQVKSELSLEKEELDKELKDWGSKIDTLTSFNAKQKTEADNMLKNLVDEGEKIQTRLEKAKKLIDQRERRAKRAQDANGADAEESETLSSLSSLEPEKKNERIQTQESSADNSSRSRSSSRDQSSEETSTAAAPLPKKSTESSPETPSKNDSKSKSKSREGSSSSSSSKSSSKKTQDPGDKEKSPAATAPAVPITSLLPASVQSSTSKNSDEKPASDKPKKEKSAGCFSCFGGKKKK